jgi:hypothetical protein
LTNTCHLTVMGEMVPLAQVNHSRRAILHPEKGVK